MSARCGGAFFAPGPVPELECDDPSLTGPIHDHGRDIVLRRSR
jgi:hypothetical protein